MRRTILLATAVMWGFLSVSRRKRQGTQATRWRKRPPPQKPNVVQAAASQVNARDYGTTGDGTTDDTAALQAALEAAATKGPVCLVPAGHYRVNGCSVCRRA